MLDQNLIEICGKNIQYHFDDCHIVYASVNHGESSEYKFDKACLLPVNVHVYHSWLVISENKICIKPILFSCFYFIHMLRQRTWIMIWLELEMTNPYIHIRSIIHKCLCDMVTPLNCQQSLTGTKSAQNDNLQSSYKSLHALWQIWQHCHNIMLKVLKIITRRWYQNMWGGYECRSKYSFTIQC